MINNLREHALDLCPQYLFLCMFSLLIYIFSINLLSNSRNPKLSIHESNLFSSWFNSLTQWVSATDNHTLKLQSVPQISYCMTHRMTPLIYIKRKPIYHFLWYLSDAILSFWSFDSPSFHSLSLYLNRVQYTQRTKSHNSFGTSWWWVNHHHFHFWVNYVFTKCLRSYRKNIIISAILSINTICIIHWAFTHIKRSILPSN